MDFIHTHTVSTTWFAVIRILFGVLVVSSMVFYDDPCPWVARLSLIMNCMALYF